MSANRPMSALRARTPVTLEEADWPLWLGEVDGDALGLRPAADDVLTLWPDAGLGAVIRSCVQPSVTGGGTPAA